jgi:translation initiation factor 2 beta subunit (eIF-2beta)/eIF-5
MIRNIEVTGKELALFLRKEDTIVIDWSDLNQAYHQFKRCFGMKPVDRIIHSNKPTLCLKMHQRLGVSKTLRLKADQKKKVLWGHIQRSGKSYMIGGCIIEDSFEKEECNYLVLTTAPNETIEQQRLVFDCIQLEEFTIITLNGSSSKPTLSKKNIIICSKQFLQTKIDAPENTCPGKTKSIGWLKQQTFDMRFIDESHNGGTTELAQKTLRYYGGDSFTVQITATYSKPVNDYHIPLDSCILWDLEDIKLCKHLDQPGIMRRLVDKHGEDIRTLCTMYATRDIITEYSKYPDLWVLTDRIHPDTKNNLIDITRDTPYGWSTDACFLLKQCTEDDKETGAKRVRVMNEFQNEEEQLKLWYRIFGKRNVFGIPDQGYPDEDVFLKRIESICKNPDINSRYIGEGEFRNEPMIIMAFLPQNNIDKLSSALCSLLETHHVIPDYEIVSINSKLTNHPKQSIEDARIRARTCGKKGVLVLSGKQCSLGVSIDNCDIVLLLNNNMGFDMIYQMMFRCMTEGKHKTCGFVVDLNIHRVINTTTIPYASLIKPEQHPRDAINYILQERLLTLNGDHWIPSFGKDGSDITTFCETIYDVYSSNTGSALAHLLHRLRMKEISLNEEDQTILNNTFKHISNKQHRDNVDTDKQTKKGIEVIPVGGGGGDKDHEPHVSEATVDDDCDGSVSMTYVNYIDILKHIIPLVCLLTIHSDHTLFVDMFRVIQNDSRIYDILLNQTKRWWGGQIDSAVIGTFIDVYVKYVRNDKETTQLIRAVKELFLKHSRNRKELSTLIDTYLLPQELERKQHAEVSTPFQLRQEMLDQIPDAFWTMPKRVLEPCSGKGGFLIDIIDRFMDGLVDLIPDETIRYKTIVEECLYFSDINPTNLFLCKLLIDPVNEYQLHSYEGSTLNLDTAETWGVDKFDAVIGNPPYQPPSNHKKGGKSIWSEFVTYSIRVLRERGLLVFVHPALWRKPGNQIGELLFNKQIHSLSIHNKKEGTRVFGATTRYDYYLIENTPPVLTSKVRFEDAREHELLICSELPFIPNFGWSVFEKVMKKGKNPGVHVIRDSDCHTSRPYVSKLESEEYRFPLLNSISKTKGKTYRFSSRPHKNQTQKKVIFSNGETIVPFYDDGVVGVTEGGLYVIVDTCHTGGKLVDYLNTNLIKFLIKATKWSNFETNKQLFHYIPNIISDLDDITNERVCGYFGLTEEEIVMIGGV